MTTRWARVARGLVAAAVSLFAAAALHILAGGPIPTVVAIVSCFVVSSFVCVALSGKRLSLPKLGAAVALSQFLFHSVFSMWTARPTIDAGTRQMHDHLMVFLPHVDPALSANPAISADSGMWLAHAMAAVATIVALRHGETAFWGLLATARLWIGTIFAKLAIAVPARTPGPVIPVQPVVPARGLVLLLSSLQHRGPPMSGTPAFAAA